MEASLILCDFAQVSQGKLNIIGGGWTRLSRVGSPVSLSLAAIVTLRLEETSQSHTWVAEVFDDADTSLTSAEGEMTPLLLDEEPPGAIQVPFALNMHGITLGEGRYEWRLSFDGTVAGSAPFVVAAEPDDERQAPAPAEEG